jgi:hypothetical protein
MLLRLAKAPGSARVESLVYHPGGPPTYRPCGVSGFDHVYGAWYVTKRPRHGPICFA